MYDEEKWFSASNANSVTGVAVYTQLAFKADSLRCGQWAVLIQNPVEGKRRQRGCQNGKHKLSWGKTMDTGLENEEQRCEG